MLIIFVAACLGALLGWLGAHATVLGWWTLLPWALGGLAIGYMARARPLLAGAVYGFILSFVFMSGVYTGTASVVSRIPFFALLGVVGAVCGLTLAVAGRWLAGRVAIASQRSS